MSGPAGKDAEDFTDAPTKGLITDILIRLEVEAAAEADVKAVCDKERQRQVKEETDDDNAHEGQFLSVPACTRTFCQPSPCARPTQVAEAFASRFDGDQKDRGSQLRKGLGGCSVWSPR